MNFPCKPGSSREFPEALRLNFSDFLNIQFIRQGDLLGILGSGGVQLQRHLMRWNNISFWSEIESNISSKINQVSKELEVLEIKRDRCLKDLDEIEYIDVGEMKNKLDNMKLVMRQSDLLDNERLEIEELLNLRESSKSKNDLKKNERKKVSLSFRKIDPKIEKEIVENGPKW